jgi:hypothetical protein
LLACAQPAEAYISATKTNVVVPINGGAVYFDLNGDGIPDVGLSANQFYDCPQGAAKRSGDAHPLLGCVFGGHLNALTPQAGDEVEGQGGYAAALPKGANIGSARPFAAGRVAMGVLSGTGSGSHLYGKWLGDHAGPYLGVKFTDAEQNVHYGWVRVSLQQSGTKFSATITAYAYETEPNQPITAGAITGSDHADATQPAEIFPATQESATLGRLAQGAAGLVAWRRERDLAIA